MVRIGIEYRLYWRVEIVFYLSAVSGVTRTHCITLIFKLRLPPHPSTRCGRFGGLLMLAAAQIEILGDAEKIFAERVGEGGGAVHPSESGASQRPARALARGAKWPYFMTSLRGGGG